MTRRPTLFFSPLEGGPGGITPPPARARVSARGTPLPTSPLKGGRRENKGGGEKAAAPHGQAGRRLTRLRNASAAWLKASAFSMFGQCPHSSWTMTSAPGMRAARAGA